MEVRQCNKPGCDVDYLVECTHKNPWLLKFKYRTNDNRHAFKKNAYKARSNAKRVTYPVTSPGRPGYNWHEKVKKN